MGLEGSSRGWKREGRSQAKKIWAAPFDPLGAFCLVGAPQAIPPRLAPRPGPTQRRSASRGSLATPPDNFSGQFEPKKSAKHFSYRFGGLQP